MPRTTTNSACGNNLSQEESEVPSSPEDIVSSDHKKDQEPGPEDSFHHLGHNKPFQTCSYHTQRVPRWTGQQIMLSTKDF